MDRNSVRDLYADVTREWWFWAALWRIAFLVMLLVTLWLVQ